MQQLLRLNAMGKGPKECAEMLGMTQAGVSELLNHVEFARLQQEYLPQLYGPLDEQIRERTATNILGDAAPDAADALVQLLDSDDEVNVRLASTAILDRTGHGPIQRRAVRQKIELDPVSAQLIGAALKEANSVAGFKGGPVLEAEPVGRELGASGEDSD